MAFPGGGAGNDRLQFWFGRDHRTRVIPFRQIQFQSLGRRESRKTTTARFLENRTERSNNPFYHYRRAASFAKLVGERVHRWHRQL